MNKSSKAGLPPPLESALVEELRMEMEAEVQAEVEAEFSARFREQEKERLREQVREQLRAEHRARLEAQVKLPKSAQISKPPAETKTAKVHRLPHIPEPTKDQKPVSQTLLDSTWVCAQCDVAGVVREVFGVRWVDNDWYSQAYCIKCRDLAAQESYKRRKARKAEEREKMGLLQLRGRERVAALQKRKLSP